MIRINKSTAVPTTLLVQGVAATNSLKAQYDLNPSAYRQKYHKITNPFKFKIEPSIYAARDVKQKLTDDQFEKCVFCESDFIHVSVGDVEHFRPKKGYRQNANDRPIGKPGYYWLAYEWENLFLSCEICNRYQKKDRFPLKARAVRAIDHHDPRGQEADSDTLLVHPSRENPEDHITFVKHLIVPKNKSQKGRKSIEVFGLKRPILVERRRKFLQDFQRDRALERLWGNKTVDSLSAQEKADYKSILGIHSMSDSELQELFQAAIDSANNGARANFPYAGMIRANFPSLPTAPLLSGQT